MVYPCGKQYGDLSKKLKIELPYNPAIPLLGIYSKYSERGRCWGIIWRKEELRGKKRNNGRDVLGRCGEWVSLVESPYLRVNSL